MEKTIDRILGVVNCQAEGPMAPVARFNLEVFLTKAKYADILRVLTTAADSGALELSYQEAIEQKIFSATGTLNGKQLHAWAEKAKTKEFSDRVAVRQRLEESRRRNVDGTTALEMKRLNTYKAMRAQYAAVMSSTGKQHDEVAEQLLSKLETGKSEALSDLTTLFSVVADYPEESESEMNRKCWERFSAQEVAAEHPMPALTNDNLEEAILNFEELVRTEHLTTYLRDPERAKKLDELLEAHMAGLVSTLRVKGLEKLGFTINRALSTLFLKFEPTYDRSKLPNGFRAPLPSFDSPDAAQPTTSQKRGKKRHREQDPYGDDNIPCSQTHRGREKSRSSLPPDGTLAISPTAQVMSDEPQRRATKTRNASAAAAAAIATTCSSDTSELSSLQLSSGDSSFEESGAEGTDAKETPVEVKKEPNTGKTPGKLRLRLSGPRLRRE
ncbi:hypothetical protein H2199_001628 [Coniosporium tulheliwenetii]|uniref:Uncharacterized protein n=1 Tax=Coniosporium tulheliwenetii TaxID=3383036 RepID=A0ACC2ZJX9_9PEZI|nr:hypothetical protein H2199_001628 [Cladosporium sp. JES 115]